MDIVCGIYQWDVAISFNNDGKIQGVLPYFIGKKWIISTSIQALLTPYLGPYLVYPHNMDKNVSIYGYQMKVVQELINQLPSVHLSKMRLMPEYGNWMPFYFNNYNQTSRYTYRIFPDSESILKNNLKSNVRNDLAKGYKTFTIKRDIDVDTLYQLNTKTFKRKNQNPPFGKDHLQKLVDVLREHKQVSMYSAYVESYPAASIMIVNDQQCAYCLLIGLDKSIGKGGAVQLLLWEAIKDANKKGLIFDFEGSMIPEVEPVFRSFGGTLTPYHVVSKSNKWLGAIYHIWKGQNF